ncbi:hypothetical protein UF75_3724 [Desulfosporosinus sp. I2]|nr:hypothetical protein UF75_3724 [Desulfosporosinus sp. I2]
MSEIREYFTGKGEMDTHIKLRVLFEVQTDKLTNKLTSKFEQGKKNPCQNKGRGFF